MDEIDNYIEENVIPGYGMKLLNRNDFVGLLDLCSINGIGIYGFDGFHLFEKGGVQIEQDYSSDYSKITSGESLKRAYNFFKENTEGGIGYEVVLRR